MHRGVIILAILAALGLGVACAAQPGAPGGASAPAAGPAGAQAQPAQPSTGGAAAQAGQARPAAPAATGTVTVYSGREEKLVGPLIERLKRETGLDAKVRYGDTSELAAAILEEGDRSPADAFFAQDAGALGALSARGLFVRLPDGILNQVPEAFRSPRGEWVGISGRARTVVYNTTLLREQDLPDSMLGFTDPKWKGKIGWAPTNGSFQAFVTALRATEGEEGARKWLKDVLANQPKVYKNNTAIVDAVGKGEVLVGFVNHYYLFNFLRERGESFPARNYYPRAGDSGAMVNVAGVGILKTAKNRAGAERFAEYLLASDAQQYFADKTFEYPLVAGARIHPTLVPLAQIRLPKLDLGNLADLEGTLKLLRDVGVL